MARKKAAKKSNKKTAAKAKSKGAGKPRSPSSKPGPSATGSSEPAAPPPKTRLSDQELDQFRRMLLEKRAELVGDVRNMTNEALRDNPPGSSGNLSSVPIHMADMGSDNWEQEFTLGLLETERQLLKEIDAALQRIDDRTFGVCQATHKPITKRRLKAQPWARYCIEHARALELRKNPH